MDSGSRSGQVAAAPGIAWTRAALAWMLMMLLETANGLVREVMIAPAIGSLRARQWGVLAGSILVLATTCVLSRWLRATTRRMQLAVGAFWVTLTVAFELLLGRAMNQSWPRILSDYNPAQGGLLLLGLAVMCLAPWLVAEWLKYWRR